MDDDLWDLIERRWTARTIEKKEGTTKLSEFVFHRGGEPVVDFRKSWKDGCKEAKSTVVCSMISDAQPSET